MTISGFFVSLNLLWPAALLANLCRRMWKIGSLMAVPYTRLYDHVVGVWLFRKIKWNNLKQYDTTTCVEENVLENWTPVGFWSLLRWTHFGRFVGCDRGGPKFTNSAWKRAKAFNHRQVDDFTGKLMVFTTFYRFTSWTSSFSAQLLQNRMTDDSYRAGAQLHTPSRWNSVVRKRSRSHKCNAGRAESGVKLLNQLSTYPWNSMEFHEIRPYKTTLCSSFIPANYIMSYIYIHMYIFIHMHTHTHISVVLCINLYAISLLFSSAELLRLPGSSLRCSTATRISRRWCDWLAWRPCYCGGDS